MSRRSFAPKQQFSQDVIAAWQEEAASVDRCVRILPSVKEIDCIYT